MTRIPVACALDSATLGTRTHEWARLLARGSARTAVVAGGVELHLSDDVGQELQRLVEAERRCCAWAEWSVSTTADGVVLRATAAEDPGPAVLRALFMVEDR